MSPRPENCERFRLTLSEREAYIQERHEGFPSWCKTVTREKIRNAFVRFHICPLPFQFRKGEFF
ncbi:hypothetical protein ABH19_11025 [Leptospirillum sp. Group II 'CF-1']|uniref:Uncharacterized protein n=1 Tax=Leptospirillum ferriphilum YSK TaxID=1441628 RepID=A0A059Y336_9BACT|nr:hypothetical protein Y981_10415 [Leptospirillum ferriphilum YSK]AKS24157.1 hypothetical protein ABH19_11025 [Leptospirillum sp. Group II 'CF-1']